MQTFTLEKSFTKLVWLFSFAGLFLYTQAASAEWKFDFSRRQKQINELEADKTTESVSQKRIDKNLDDAIPQNPNNEISEVKPISVESSEPATEVVIAQTEKGFIPAQLRLHKGANYLIHVVNLNEKEKNVSFVLDGFSEHHSTFFGKIKSFRLTPKKEGTFPFFSPETSVEGKVVVFSEDKNRSMAGEHEP